MSLLDKFDNWKYLPHLIGITMGAGVAVVLWVMVSAALGLGG